MRRQLSATVFAAGILVAYASSAVAATEKMLYAFAAPDNTHLSSPYDRLAIDSHGNLYGTAQRGGPSTNGGAFELTSTGIYSTLYFAKAPGLMPYDLALSAQGTPIVTGLGLKENYVSGIGFYLTTGALTELLPDGRSKSLVLPGFPGPGNPIGPVTTDGRGNVVGVAQSGGYEFGGVFQLTPDGTFTMLFNNYTPQFYGGVNPGLVLDKIGNIYATTTTPGVNPATSTVLQIAPKGTVTVLYRFKTAPCYGIQSPLLLDGAGNIYGTTSGSFTTDGGCIYKLSIGGKFQLLYAGEETGPYVNGGLVSDATGNLYGSSKGTGFSSKGSVFRLAPDGTFTMLYQFSGPDGSAPGQLVIDGAGNLYGETSSGGPNGGGTLFEITP